MICLQTALSCAHYGAPIRIIELTYTQYSIGVRRIEERELALRYLNSVSGRLDCAVAYAAYTTIRRAHSSQ